MPNLHAYVHRWLVVLRTCSICKPLYGDYCIRSYSAFIGHCFTNIVCFVGKNVTPAQLSAKVRSKLTSLCDEALLKSIQLFPNCKSLVGVGRFAEQRIHEVCKAGSLPHQQMYLLHPSPQNPHANQHWTSTARKRFEELGILPSVNVSEAEAVKRNLLF